MRESGVNPIIVDAGDLFFSTKKIGSENRNSEEFRARAILEGYQKIGCDAMNIGHYEMLNGLSFLKNLSKQTSIPFLSANLKDASDEQLIFKPYIIVQREDIKIGIIGVTNMLPDTSKKIIADNYIESGNFYAEKLSKEVDLIIALVNADRASQGELVELMPQVDFIVTSGSTNMSRPNSPQKEGGPYLYSCGKQGKYLISLDVDIKDRNKPFIDVTAEQSNINSINKRFERLQKKDPKKSLEEIYSEQKNVLNLIKQYRSELKASESRVASAVNTLKLMAFPLGKKVKDDVELLAFVNDKVKTCNALNPKKTAEAKKISNNKSTKIKNKDSHAGHNH